MCPKIQKLSFSLHKSIETDLTRDLELRNKLINDLDLHINDENELFHELTETHDIENESEIIETASTVSIWVHYIVKIHYLVNFSPAPKIFTIESI